MIVSHEGNGDEMRREFLLIMIVAHEGNGDEMRREFCYVAFFNGKRREYIKYWILK